MNNHLFLIIILVVIIIFLNVNELLMSIKKNSCKYSYKMYFKVGTDIYVCSVYWQLIVIG